MLRLLEATPKAGAAIVQKTWAERLNDTPELESDADEQLLMYIPLGPSLELLKSLCGIMVWFFAHLQNRRIPPFPSSELEKQV